MVTFRNGLTACLLTPVNLLLTINLVQVHKEEDIEDVATYVLSQANQAG